MRRYFTLFVFMSFVFGTRVFDRSNDESPLELKSLIIPTEDGKIPTLNLEGKRLPVIDLATSNYLELVSDLPHAGLRRCGERLRFHYQEGARAKFRKSVRLDLDDIDKLKKILRKNVRGILLAWVLHFFDTPK